MRLGGAVEILTALWQNCVFLLLFAELIEIRNLNVCEDKNCKNTFNLTKKRAPSVIFDIVPRCAIKNASAHTFPKYAKNARKRYSNCTKYLLYICLYCYF